MCGQSPCMSIDVKDRSKELITTITLVTTPTVYQLVSVSARYQKMSSKLRDIFDMGRSALHKHLCEHGVTSIAIRGNHTHEQVFRWSEIKQIMEN